MVGEKVLYGTIRVVISAYLNQFFYYARCCVMATVVTEKFKAMKNKVAEIKL